MSRMVIVFVAVFAWFGLALPAHADDDFEARLAADLATRDAAAVEAFNAGNDAREQQAWGQAAVRYQDALAVDPEFFHARRRLCGALSALGNHEQARTECRTALDQADTPENQAGMLIAYASDPELGATYHEEVSVLANQLLDGPEADDPMTLMAICQGAVSIERLDLLERCHRLLRTLPDAPPEAHMFGWIIAMSQGDLGDAEDELEAAEAAGVDPALVAEMRQATKDATPWWHTAGTWLGTALLGWFGVFALLVLAGMLLSHLTLRSAESLSGTRTDEATGGGLRKLYAVVLALTCAFYYVSLPLTLVVVLALGAGVIYGMLALGFISLKLGLVVIIAVLVTAGALTKSLFVKTSDEAPGDAVDLTKTPKLRELLDAVADRVGTRPVDTVYLTPGADVAVFERGGMGKKLTSTPERCLILGVAALDGMTAPQLKAILAHEYGHFSNRDTAGGGFALAVRRSMVHFAEGLAIEGMANPLNPAWLFVSSFYKLFLRISHGASRLQEVLADRRAVFAYGAEAFEGGLRHVVDREVRFDVDTEAYLNAVIENEQPLHNLYEESLGHVSAGSNEIDERVQELLESEPSAFDSHPRPLDRIRWAHALETNLPPDPDAGVDAWDIVGAKETLQLQMTEHVRTSIARNLNVKIPR